MKKKWIVTVSIVVVILVLLGGGYLFLSNRAAKQTQQDDGFITEDTAKPLDPNEIGLKMEANPSKKAVKFSIAKATGIQSVEYQVIYEADSTAAERRQGSDDRVQRGITGQALVAKGASSFESEWLDLGTCSHNICRYDSGVSEISLTLKIVKAGKTYVVEQKLSL